MLKFALDMAPFAPLIQAIASVIGLFTILILWKQISQTNKWNRLSAAFNYLNMDKYHEIEQKAIQETNKLNIKITDIITKENSETIRKNDEARYACGALLRYFEQLCLAYKYKYVNDKVIINTISPLIVGYFNNFKSYINLIRIDTHGSLAFKEWERIANKLNKEITKEHIKYLKNPTS